MRHAHKHLHLQHHRHTGRVLRHRHTSYRGLAVVIGLAGGLVLLLNTMARAAADTLTVYARNPAPIPTLPAVITNPTNNAVVNKEQLLVGGTCEASDPANIITVLDNGIVAGSTTCQNDGTFSLPITITVGKHTLIARTYTITDDTGPDSEAVIVFRITDSTSTGGSTINDQPHNGTPLFVTIDRPFIVFGPAKEAVWIGTVGGGTLPYKVVINWGDGNTKLYTVTKAGEQRFAHHYHAMHPYVIGFKVTDTDGRSVVRQYAAVTPYQPPVYGAAPVEPWTGSVPLGLYGAYLLLLVLFGGLWVRAHPFAYAPVPVRKQPRTKRTQRTKRVR